MSRKTLSDNEIRLILSNNDDLGEEELIPCNDSEVEDNVLHDDSDKSPSSDADSETNENDIQDYITSRDATKWSKVPHKSKGRTLKRNMLRQAPGLTRYSQELNTPLGAFQLLFSDKITDIIIECSEKKAAKLDHPEWKLEDGHLFY